MVQWLAIAGRRSLVLLITAAAWTVPAAHGDELEEVQAEVDQAVTTLKAFIADMDTRYGTTSSSLSARATIEKLDITQRLKELPAQFLAENPTSGHRLEDYGRQFAVIAGDRIHGVWHANGAYRWTHWYGHEVKDEELVGSQVRQIAPRDYLQRHVYRLEAVARKIKELARTGNDATAISSDDLRSSLRALAEKQEQIAALFDGPMLEACGQVGALQLEVGRAKAGQLRLLSRRSSKAAREQAKALHDQAEREMPGKALRIFASPLQRLRSAVATEIPISLRAVQVTIVERSSFEALDHVAPGESFAVLVRFGTPPREEAVSLFITSPSDRQQTLVARRVVGNAGLYRAEGPAIQPPEREARDTVLRARPGDTIGARLEEGGYDTVEVRPSCDELNAEDDSLKREMAELEKQAAALARMIAHDEAELERARRSAVVKETEAGDLEKQKALLDAQRERLDAALREIERARSALLAGLPKAARHRLALEMYDVRDSSTRVLTEAEQRDFMRVSGEQGSFDQAVLTAKRSMIARFAWGLGQTAQMLLNLEPQPRGGSGEVWQVWAEQLFKVRDPGALGDAEFLSRDPAFRARISLPEDLIEDEAKAKQAYDDLLRVLGEIEEKRNAGADETTLREELGRVNAPVVTFLTLLKEYTASLAARREQLDTDSRERAEKLEAIGLGEVREAIEFLEDFLGQRRQRQDALRAEMEGLKARIDAVRALREKYCGGR